MARGARRTAGLNRVWLDVEAGIYAVVSDEDHAWAIQWCWQITWDRHKRKAYATRSTSDGPRRIKLYLHKEILKRSGKLPSQNRRTARKPIPEPPAVQEEIPF